MRAPLERVFHWQRIIGGKDRQGETCTVIGEFGTFGDRRQVRFADGTTAIVERKALRAPQASK